MKESSGKTKKTSKGVKRARSMRNVVMMVLICALMLSAATYAWFTLSDTARITNLTMTVGEESSLLIAEDLQQAQAAGRPGEYKGSLVFGTDGTNNTYELKGTLLPASLESASGDIKKPDYNDLGQVKTDLLELTSSDIMLDSSEEGDFYCYKTTFYLKNGGSEEEIQVQLKAPTSEISGNTKGTQAASDGTYMINKANEIGASAIRIRFTDEDSHVIIYEPLYDTENTAASESAQDLNENRTVAASTDIQKYTGAFTSNDRGKLTVTNTGTRITMEVWLEGTDDLCCNEVMADVISGQIAFEVVDTTSGN